MGAIVALAAVCCPGRRRSGGCRRARPRRPPSKTVTTTVEAASTGGNGTAGGASSSADANAAFARSGGKSVSEIYKNDAPGVVTITSTIPSTTSGDFSPFGPGQGSGRDRPGLGLRDRQAGPHPHQRPRRRGCHLGRRGLRGRRHREGDGARPRLALRPRRDQGRRSPERTASAQAGQRQHRSGGRSGRRDRQSVRLRADRDRRHRVRQGPHPHLARRRDEDHSRRDPDRRRHQPRQFGRPTLIDRHGDVIAINAQIADPQVTGTNANAGVGFAIPIDLAKRALKNLEQGKPASHPYLGIRVDALNNSLRPRIPSCPRAAC